MSRYIGELFKDSDIFGLPVTVNYRGRDTYKTKLGAFCSLFAYVLISINLVTLTTHWVQGTR